jgi:hypothetical protein
MNIFAWIRPTALIENRHQQVGPVRNMVYERAPFSRLPGELRITRASILNSFENGHPCCG